MQKRLPGFRDSFILILCISDFELQCKHLEKFKSYLVTKNRRRKSKVFCMYGTIALRSSRLFMTRELQICSYSKIAHATLHFSAVCECSEYFSSSVARFTTPAFVEYTYRVIHVLQSNLLQQRLSGCNSLVFQQLLQSSENGVYLFFWNMEGFFPLLFCR